MSCWPALQPSHHSRLSGLLLASWAKNFYCKQLLQKQHWANRICSVFFQKRFLFEIFQIELASASLCLLSLFLFQSRQTLLSARSLEKKSRPNNQSFFNKSGYESSKKARIYVDSLFQLLFSKRYTHSICICFAYAYVILRPAAHLSWNILSTIRPPISL